MSGNNLINFIGYNKYNNRKTAQKIRVNTFSK